MFFGSGIVTTKFSFATGILGPGGCSSNFYLEVLMSFSVESKPPPPPLPRLGYIRERNSWVRTSRLKLLETRYISVTRAELGRKHISVLNFRWQIMACAFWWRGKHEAIFSSTEKHGASGIELSAGRFPAHVPCTRFELKGAVWPDLKNWSPPTIEFQDILPWWCLDTNRRRNRRQRQKAEKWHYRFSGCSWLQGPSHQWSCEDTFERLLRFSLYNQNTLENLQCGSNVVVIVHCFMMTADLAGKSKNDLESEKDRITLNFQIFQCISLIEWVKGNTSSPPAPLICKFWEVMEPMEMGIGCSAKTFLEA